MPGGDRTAEEIRMALDAYHRELAKLNTCQNPAAQGISGILKFPKRSHFLEFR